MLLLLVWGTAGFGMMVPQQSRLAALAPACKRRSLLSLNASMLYLGTARRRHRGGGALGFAAGGLCAAQLGWRAVRRGRPCESCGLPLH